MTSINDTELGKYIKELIHRNGWSLRNAAFKIGVSPAYLSKLVNGKADSNPKPATLDKIAHGLKANEQDIYKIAGYLTLSNDKRDQDVERASLAKENYEDVWKALNSSGKPIVLTDSLPVYGQIHAGPPSFADQNIIGNTPVTSNLISQYGKDNLFALQIKGDSMSRVIPDGYVAIFAKDIQPENNDIVATLIDGDDATIKRFKETSMAVMFEPDSYNPIYKPIVFQKKGNKILEY